MALPYPGHTWSLTQHAIAMDASTLHELLKFASLFEGQTDFSSSITALMVRRDILTANVRDGQNDAWRDYQQILPELGLIFSTRIHPALRLTQAGELLLAGEIGFSELMTTQAMRYQYPNGHKAVIAARLRDELVSAGRRSIPSTLTEVQADAGMLLKPGLLVLRTLIELARRGLPEPLTVNECITYLLPVRKNSEWENAVAQLIRKRRSGVELTPMNVHARRNLQDWFKFLSKTDYFALGTVNQLSLTNYAMRNIDLLESECSRQEAADTFWIPTSYDREGLLDWFEWYGEVPLFEQAVVPSQELSDSYIRENYIGGLDDEENEESHGGDIESSALNLRPVDELALADHGTSGESDIDDDTLLERLRAGFIKRHAKTKLHDAIIIELAQKFRAQGAVVFDDPNSVDLLVTWPNGEEAIFEVKTVTKRSLQDRLRRAVGQLEEYAYRRTLGSGRALPDRIIVVNATLPAEAWQIGYLTDHMEIGVICRPRKSYSAYAPENSVTRLHWSM
jgi:hypothetical protein